MREAELRRALEPVRAYFSGKEVSTNTVLAAYLRSNGLPASGQPWEIAKRAINQGANFEEAVLAATEHLSRGVVLVPVASNEEPRPFEGSALGWFPKQFGPGDIDGVGAKRLLGTPNLDPAWVLVRETAQNSWDARGAARTIQFVLNLRLLEKPIVEALRSRVFTGNAPNIGLAELLSREEIWALEVTDRGTVGLGGPIRNDLAVDPGEDTNFIDLVFNIGAPRDVHLGAGTYGFGKTIAYVVSGVGTVLIWSRCEGSRGREYRLIGSAVGDGFNMEGLRYTGRHWWGNVIAEDDRVEPIIGDLAEELGETVFATGFDGDATGTSILILDPQLGGSSREKDLELLVEAAMWNLWPKLLADQTDRSRMRINISLNGEPVALPEIEQHPVLSGHAECLLAVRARQSGSDQEVSLRYPVDVQEVWCNRPQTLLGHLALTRYPSTRNGDLLPSHGIALMRYQAELVVKYFERQELDVEGFQWAGVFKPVAELDDSFALAEPPAHDDWVPQAVQDSRRRREVNVALKRIKDAADAFLLPRHPNLSAQGVPASAASVGDMLADLLAGLDGPGPSMRAAAATAVEPRHQARPAPAQSTAPYGGVEKRSGRPQVQMLGATYEPAHRTDWSRTTIDVQLASTQPMGSTRVTVTVRVAVDGGSLDDHDVVHVLGWVGTGSDTFDPGPQEFSPGDIRRFAYEARSDLAIDVETKVAES